MVALDNDILDGGSCLMYCACGHTAVYVKAMIEGFEPTTKFYAVDGTELRECPHCKIKWSKPERTGTREKRRGE